MPAPTAAPLLSPESLSASGRSGERLSLPSLQSKMKIDPEGYEAELLLLLRHFDSSLHLFRAQSALSPSSDPAVAKDLADLAMFLSHVAPFYPIHLSSFPSHLSGLLRSDARSLPSSLRCHLAQSLILLVNRKIVSIEQTLELFMDLQVLGDQTLRKLAFSHVVHSIRRMNQKHKNEAENRKLQNILFTIVQGDDESRAKRALIVLCDLHRRRVWFDDRTANAICTACFHSSSRIMKAALSFLLGYERVGEGDDSDASSSEDDTNENPQVVLSREAVYKAKHKGTAASKKKKKARLQRVIRSMKRKQRTSEDKTSNYYSPLTHLKDAQGFVEKLFSRLQKCNERFEVKMTMLKVIARTIGLHRLILLNFYPFLQKYVQPHQTDVTELIAAAIQACHDMVPPDAVEPLFRQIVNQFVHDKSRTEAIAVGLNAVREICIRLPLLMNEDLLQDLVLYKKSHEKAISTAARSLISLYRTVCPTFLLKKDRGRPIDPKARPKAFGEFSVVSDVPGIELLDDNDDSTLSGSDDVAEASDGDEELDQLSASDDDTDGDAVSNAQENASNQTNEEEDSESEAQREDDGENEEEVEDGKDIDTDDDSLNDDDVIVGPEEGAQKYNDHDNDDDDNCSRQPGDGDNDVDDDDGEDEDDEDVDDEEVVVKSNARKRKFVDYVGQLKAANTSLRALKRIAEAQIAQVPLESNDGILSNEDFKRIKELKAKKETKLALTRQGLLKKGSDSKVPAFKIPSSEQLSVKRVDPAKLEVNIKKKLNKEERLALVRAGREDRGKYQARAAVKQKKTGGTSNLQKEHKKAMPLAAKRAKIARSRQEKKQQQRRSGKQFRGKKAWK